MHDVLRAGVGSPTTRVRTCSTIIEVLGPLVLSVATSHRAVGRPGLSHTVDPAELWARLKLSVAVRFRRTAPGSAAAGDEYGPVGVVQDGMRGRSYGAPDESVTFGSHHCYSGAFGGV